MRKCALVVLAALLLPGASLAQTTISTSYTEGGIGVFGNGHVETAGQTFTSVDQRFLTSFAFWMPDTPDLFFIAYVYRWDDVAFMATGPALYSSAVFSQGDVISGPLLGGRVRKVTINTGPVVLAPRGMFVAFLSTSGTPGTGATSWSLATGGQYAGGQAVWLNNGPDAGRYTTEQWGRIELLDADMLFEISFARTPATTIPEPVSMILLGTGLAGMGAVARRRKMATRVESDPQR